MLLLQRQFAPPPPKKKKYMTLCVIGRVRLERNCGKMYSRLLFPYGGLLILDFPSVTLMDMILCC